MKDTLHFHAGGTCHGAPTLQECVREALDRGWVGRILERTETSSTGKPVRCYSLIASHFDHWAKHGRFVAEITTKTSVEYL